MIRTRLRYHAPEDIEEACSLLGAREEAAVLGGGTWLVPLMTRGERRVSDVVDLRRLDLGVIEDGDGQVVVGAMATYAEVLASSVLRERAPLLYTAAAGVTGGKQIHNLGTLGGSACYAFPSSDVPACLVALGARMRIYGAAGVREVPAQEFFLDAFRSAAGPGEILTSIVIPVLASGVGYYKLKLSEGSWPIATAAAVAGDAASNTELGPSVTLGGVARTPLRIDATEVLDSAAGDGVTERLDALIAEHLTDPWDDELAPAWYRRSVAPAVARRALKQAIEGRER
ncbi:MAG: FAD binding domain-containing protein [Solirubrobacterales bacterium]|nr:FAD binding domain-containing protein [Solirubrobacterales bacterium]